jgi:tetratricopeptide (TPR) repeat protein
MLARCVTIPLGVTMKLRLAFALCAALIATRIAHAQDDESLNRAREHFDRGQTLFEQKLYPDAAQQFLQAYEARKFPAFLYNAALAFEEIPDYAKAVEYYKRYLGEQPDAKDRADVEKRIAVFEAEIERLKAQPPPAPPPPAPDGTTPTTQPTPAPAPATPSPEVQALADAKIRGLVVIESKPQGAYIYLDDKKQEPLGRTPWNGTLDGRHTVFIEAKGYKPEERMITSASDKVNILYFALAEEDYLGWIDIRANVPGAQIYLDDKVAVFRASPYSGNIKPGKHKVWITKEGYSEFFQEIDIVPGQTHEIKANLTGGEVGYINIRGRDVEHVKVYVDGLKVCDGPCRHPLGQGAHKLSIRRDGHKSYDRTVDVRAKTEITVRPMLAPKPSRTDAVVAYAFAIAFTGTGIYLGLQAKSIEDELASDIEAGMPPPAADDSRFTRGKIFAYSADAAYVLGAATFGAAVYYTFRDKGSPSTATTDVSSIAVAPQLAPGYAGLGLEASW